MFLSSSCAWDCLTVEPLITRFFGDLSDQISSRIKRHRLTTHLALPVTNAVVTPQRRQFWQARNGCGD